MKQTTNQQEEIKIITSKNSKELAEKIRLLSAEILKRNEKLYKRLENR